MLAFGNSRPCYGVLEYFRQEAARNQMPAERLQQMKERLISGTGTLPMIGDPDTVANKFKFLSDAGLNGPAGLLKGALRTTQQSAGSAGA